MPPRASAPPRYPAIPLAAPTGTRASKCLPLQRRKPKRVARCDHASARTSPPDGTARNAHRKKHIPRDGRFLLPPEKHSTRKQRPVAPRSSHQPSAFAPYRAANRTYGNVPRFAACHSFRNSLSLFVSPILREPIHAHEVQQHPRSHRQHSHHPPESPGQRFSRRSLGQSRLPESRRLGERPHRHLP